MVGSQERADGREEGETEGRSGSGSHRAMIAGAGNRITAGHVAPGLTTSAVGTPTGCETREMSSVVDIMSCLVYYDGPKS